MNDDSFLHDDIAPVSKSKPEHRRRGVHDLRAWHRPRKQWVRSNLLLPAVERVVADRHQPSDCVAYLGLPGDALLDLRVMALRLAKDCPRIRFLAFDLDREATGRETVSFDSDTEIDKAELASHAEGLIAAEDFNKIGHEHSTSRQWVKKHGPYDIVNVDLCTVEINDDQRLFDSILFILQHQANQRSDPWVLSVTGYVAPGKTIAHYQQELLQIVGQNCESDKNFKVRFEEIIANVDETSVSDADAPKWFSVAFGKWLIRTMSGAQPQWKVTMEESVWYRRQHRLNLSSGPQIVTLVFRFDRIEAILEDPSGIARSNETGEEVSEMELAHVVLDMVKGLTDVDKKMIEDAAARKEAITETVGLLQSARYNLSPNQYHAWLAEWESEAQGR